MSGSTDLSALFSCARALMQRSSDCNDEFLTLLSDALSSNLGGVEIMQLQELFDHHDAHLIQEIGWELPGLLLPCACHESVQQRSFALKVLSLIGTQASVKESLLTLSEAMSVHRAVLFPPIDDALSVDDINARIEITSQALSCACSAAASLMNRRLIALPIVSSGRQIASLLSAFFDLSAHSTQWHASVTETLEWKQCSKARPMFDVHAWLVDTVIDWTSRLYRYPEHVQEIAFDLKLNDSSSHDKPIAEMFLERRVLAAALLRLLGSSPLPAVPLKRPVYSILDNLSSEDPAATVFRIIFVGLVRNSKLELSQIAHTANTDKEEGSWYDVLDLRGSSVLCAVLVADHQIECDVIELVPFVNSLLSDDEPQRLVLGIQLAQRVITQLTRGTVRFNADTFEQMGLWRCLQLVCQFVIRCPDLQLRRVALQLLTPLVSSINPPLDRIRVVCSAAMQCQHPKLCGTFIQMVLAETQRMSNEWRLEHFKPQLQLIARRLTIKDTPKVQSLGFSADVLALMSDEDVLDAQSNSDAMFRIQIAGSDFISNLEVISGALKLLSVCMSVSLSNSEEQRLLFAFCEAIKRHFVPVVLDTCLAELRDVTIDAEQMANQLGITAEHVQQVRQRNAQLEAALHSSHSYQHDATSTSDEDQIGNELMDTLMSMYPKDAQAMAVARRHLLQVKNVIQSQLS